MILKINAKCSDLFSATLVDGNKKIIKEYEGYVPEFFPDNGGDYVALDIDMETGKILNWKPPTEEEIKEFIGEPTFDNDDNLDLSDL